MQELNEIFQGAVAFVFDWFLLVGRCEELDIWDRGFRKVFVKSKKSNIYINKTN